MGEREFTGWGLNKPRTSSYEEEEVPQKWSPNKNSEGDKEDKTSSNKLAGGLKKKRKESEQEVEGPKFEPQVTATSTIPDSDLPLWWKALMEFVAEKKVTDILFSPESYEVFCRINTKLELYQCVGKENYDRLIYNRMTQDRESTGGKHDIIVAKKTEELIEKGETDFAITTFGRRMRVNVFKSLKGICAAFRPLPNKSIPWRENALSESVIKVLDNTKQGLVLVTGPTGSGKSTTICSMIEYINEKYPYHIITIEDPIEYIFTNKKSVVDQREVEEHTNSFQSALRASLRENPDIIFVGELRDYETARTALMAADTGHLVFGTLHTRRVYSTISRLLELAPESSRSEMRAMISNALSMILCQRLLQKRGGGIHPCREVMMLNPAISALIKEGKEKGISSQLTINQSKGMLEWGRALELAQENGTISKEEAEKYRDSTEDID